MIYFFFYLFSIFLLPVIAWTEISHVSVPSMVAHEFTQLRKEIKSEMISLDLQGSSGQEANTAD